MANEFIARNGVIALNNSQITGSLNVAGGITGSFSGTASYALTASYAATSSFANSFTASNVTITGNLGIGTANPSFPLEVSSTSTTLLARFTSNQTNAAIRLVNSSAGLGRTYSIGSGNSGSAAINGFYIYDETAGSTVFAISGSGNVGIGTTTLSTNSLIRELAIGQNITNGVTKLSLRSDSTSQTAEIALSSYLGENLMSISTLSNSPMLFNTNNTERMRITSGGNVGIGTSSPASILDARAGAGTSGNILNLSSTTGAAAGNIVPIRFFSGNTFGGLEQIAAIWGINPNAGTNNGGDIVFATSTNGTATTPTEKVRISNAGVLTVGTGTGSPTGGTTKLQVIGAVSIGENTNGTAVIDAYSSYAYYGCNGSTYAIWIGPTGLVYNYSNSTTFNTSSDVRVKENINTISNALDKITALNPVTFDYKQDFATYRSWDDVRKNDNIGFIAQEFAEVFPKYVHSAEEIINEEVIEDFKTIDTGHLVPYLVKAIQEQQVQIESQNTLIQELTTRLTALENK